MILQGESPRAIVRRDALRWVAQRRHTGSRDYRNASCYQANIPLCASSSSFSLPSRGPLTGDLCCFQLPPLDQTQQQYADLEQLQLL